MGQYPRKRRHIVIIGIWTALLAVVVIVLWGLFYGISGLFFDVEINRMVARVMTFGCAITLFTLPFWDRRR